MPMPVVKETYPSFLGILICNVVVSSIQSCYVFYLFHLPLYAMRFSVELQVGRLLSVPVVHLEETF